MKCLLQAMDDLYREKIELNYYKYDTVNFINLIKLTIKLQTITNIIKCL